MLLREQDRGVLVEPDRIVGVRALTVIDSMLQRELDSAVGALADLVADLNGTTTERTGSSLIAPEVTAIVNDELVGLFEDRDDRGAALCDEPRRVLNEHHGEVGQVAIDVQR